MLFRRMQRLRSFLVRFDGVSTRIAIFVPMQRSFGLRKQGLRFAQRCRRVPRSARILGSANGLTRIAHLLHRRARTCAQQRACDENGECARP